MRWILITNRKLNAIYILFLNVYYTDTHKYNILNYNIKNNIKFIYCFIIFVYEKLILLIYFEPGNNFSIGMVNKLLDKIKN